MTFVRYLLIQVFAYGIDIGFFSLLFHFDLTGPLVSNIISKFAAGCFAFVIHRRYTFNVAASSLVGRQAFRYFAVLAAHVPVASGVLIFILIWVPMPVIAKFLSDIVMVIFSYVVSKKFIFKAHINTSPNADSVYK
jgi:putative flippase GtrA